MTKLRMDPGSAANAVRAAMNGVLTLTLRDDALCSETVSPDSHAVCANDYSVRTEKPSRPVWRAEVKEMLPLLRPYLSTGV